MMIQQTDFTKAFPDDPALRDLVTAFEQGRYDVVRVRAPELIQSTSDPDVARAAALLRSRINADPLAIRLLVGAFIMIAAISSWVYFFRSH